MKIVLTGCTTAEVREIITFETVHIERDNKNSLKELILEKNDRMTKSTIYLIDMNTPFGRTEIL